MSSPSDASRTLVDPDILRYVEGLQTGDDPFVDKLEAAGASRDFPIVGRASARVLEILARSVSATRVLEIGSGYGYSAWWFARAVGELGTVICTETDAHERDLFEQLWDRHPFRQRIAYRMGDGLEILGELEGSFDVIFLDHRKDDYPRALDLVVPRLRVGGLLLADNALWGGKVLDPQDATTQAVRRFGAWMLSEPRLRSTILPVGDGLAVGVRIQ